MHNPACDKNDSHNHTQPSVWFIIELQLTLEDMSSNIYKHMPVIGDTNQYRQPPMEILLDVYKVDQIYSTRRIAPSTTKITKEEISFLETTRNGENHVPTTTCTYKFWTRKGRQHQNLHSDVTHNMAQPCSTTSTKYDVRHYIRDWIRQRARRRKTQSTT